MEALIEDFLLFEGQEDQGGSDEEEQSEAKTHEKALMGLADRANEDGKQNHPLRSRKRGR
jgi:hypothetical protein